MWPVQHIPDALSIADKYQEFIQSILTQVLPHSYKQIGAWNANNMLNHGFGYSAGENMSPNLIKLWRNLKFCKKLK